MCLFKILVFLKEQAWIFSVFTKHIYCFIFIQLHSEQIFPTGYVGFDTYVIYYIFPEEIISNCILGEGLTICVLFGVFGLLH